MKGHRNDEGPGAHLLEERLGELDFGALRREGLGLINVDKYLSAGVVKEEGARLFSVVPSASTRDNGIKLNHKRFPLAFSL